MKRVLAIALSVLIPVLSSASEGGFKVSYDGGSISPLKSGNTVRLFIDSDKIRLSRDKEDLISLSPASITEISYGQDVHRRVGAAIGLAVVSFGIGALMALTEQRHAFQISPPPGCLKEGFKTRSNFDRY